MLVKQVFFFPALMHKSQLVHCSRTADQSLDQTDISTNNFGEGSGAPRRPPQIDKKFSNIEYLVYLLYQLSAASPPHWANGVFPYRPGGKPADWYAGCPTP